MHLLWTIIVILFALGLFIPIINSYFTNVSTEYNVDDIGEDVGQDLPDTPSDAGDVNALDLVASILAMFFWSFNVNVWINIILLEPMRIILYVLIYRLVRSGAG